MGVLLRLLISPRLPGPSLEEEVAWAEVRNLLFWMARTYTV